MEKPGAGGGEWEGPRGRLRWQGKLQQFGNFTGRSYKRDWINYEKDPHWQI